MRKSTIIGAVPLLAVSVVSGETNNTNNHDPNNPAMPCFNDICWTSWRCWYWKRTKYDAQIGNRCGLPDNVYRPGNDGAQWNTLVWGQDYYMTWTSAYAAQEDDIILEWLMFEAPGTEKPIAEDEKDMFFDYRGNGPERAVVALSQNISKATVGWSFSPRLSDFPNENLNISSIEVTGYAMERNLFRIYHPKTFNPHDHSTFDVSEPFTVIRPAEERMIKKAASNQSKADNKKLAIGVSVGVAVAWFVAFMVSWYTSAWCQRRTLEKNGILLKPGQAD